MIDLKAVNHTNRELELMLAGTKPLAVFYEEVSCLPNEEIIPEEKFAPFVASGLIVRDERVYEGEFHTGLGRKIQMRYIFFALVEQAWRMQSMALLLQIRYQLDSWQSEELERMESLLLGYTNAEVDAWCAKRFGQR